MSTKKVIFIGAFILLTIFGTRLLETVEKGTYQVRQWPVTGAIDVKATPGMWCQCFGSVDTWTVSDTFDFTKSHPMPVRFNDG